MFDIDKWNEIINTLKKNKSRTFLTAFGVFWGIFMLIIMLGSGAGLQNAIYQNMGDFATNSCFMWTNNTSMDYKGLPRGRHFRFNNSDTEALRRNIPELKSLSPRLQGWGGDENNNSIRGKKTGAFTIFGDYPDWNEIDPVEIIKGRFINNIDIKEKRKVIVIGKRVVEVLFEKDEDPMNEYIQINGVYFKVVGVFESKKGGGQAEREEQNIHMPFTTLQKTYNFGNEVGWYAMASFDDIPIDIAETKARNILKKLHSIHPDDDQAIGGFNVYTEFKKMRGLFIGINTLIWIVGIGTLIAGVIGVSNIMLVIVKERTKEIGIMRAIGATPSNVITQIIQESVFLTSIAGYVGLVFGVIIIELINIALIKSGSEGEMFKNPEVDFNIAILALIILVISGALAGIIPAKRAVHIKPIEALRGE